MNEKQRLIDHKRKHLQKKMSTAHREQILISKTKKSAEFKKDLAIVIQKSNRGFAESIEMIGQSLMGQQYVVPLRLCHSHYNQPLQTFRIKIYFIRSIANILFLDHLHRCYTNLFQSHDWVHLNHKINGQVQEVLILSFSVMVILKVIYSQTRHIFKSCNIYLRPERFRKSEFTIVVGNGATWYTL